MLYIIQECVWFCSIGVLTETLQQTDTVNLSGDDAIEMEALSLAFILDFVLQLNNC